MNHNAHPDKKSEKPRNPVLEQLFLSPKEQDSVSQALRFAAEDTHVSADDLLAEAAAKPADPIKEVKPTVEPTAPIKATAPAPSPVAAPPAARSEAAETSEELSAEKPEEKSAEKGRLFRVLSFFIPLFGTDRPLELVRKFAFLLAVVLLLGSLGSILDESVIQPAANERLNDELLSYYIDGGNATLTPEAQAYDGYPEGISDNFKQLYYLNHDMRAWLTYSATGYKDFLKVNNAVLQSSDNDYYLSHDFNRQSSKFGCLFFDYRNRITSAADKNRILIIYGHNMATGQMFSGINELIGSVDNMRVATTVTLDTLYAKSTYKVFGLVLTDATPGCTDNFHIMSTDFASDQAYADHIAAIRARSLYDFGDVDVNADDELLVLYTCSVKSKTGMEETRISVVARKLREGEAAAQDTSKIVVNEDVIMPSAWYAANDKPLHAYYKGGTTATTAKPTATTTGGKPTGTTATTGGSDNTTTPTSDNDRPTAPVVTPPTSPRPSDPTTPNTTVPPTTTPDQSGTTTDPSGTADPSVTDPNGTTDPSATDPNGTTDPSATDPSDTTDPSVTDPSVTDPTDTTSTVTDPTDPTETTTQAVAETTAGDAQSDPTDVT